MIPTKTVTIGNREIPFFSRDKIRARGQVPVEKLVVDEVYWHLPGDCLFIVKNIKGNIVEGLIDLGRWRDWVIELGGETYLYPMSDIECALLKCKIENGLK